MVLLMKILITCSLGVSLLIKCGVKFSEEMASTEQLVIGMQRAVLVDIKGSQFRDHIRCVSLATVVYFLWQERNRRIFQQVRKDWRSILLKVEENVRSVVWYWRAKREYCNWLLCKEWGLRDDVILMLSVVCGVNKVQI